jgi:hypothetical protein
MPGGSRGSTGTVTQKKVLEENMFINVKDVYDIVSKHYERYKSLFLTDFFLP